MDIGTHRPLTAKCASNLTLRELYEGLFKTFFYIYDVQCSGYVVCTIQVTFSQISFKLIINISLGRNYTYFLQIKLTQVLNYSQNSSQTIHTTLQRNYKRSFKCSIQVSTKKTFKINIRRIERLLHRKTFNNLNISQYFNMNFRDENNNVASFSTRLKWPLNWRPEYNYCFGLNPLYSW